MRWIYCKIWLQFTTSLSVSPVTPKCSYTLLACSFHTDIHIRPSDYTSSKPCFVCMHKWGWRPSVNLQCNSIKFDGNTNKKHTGPCVYVLYTLRQYYINPPTYYTPAPSLIMPCPAHYTESVLYCCKKKKEQKAQRPTVRRWNTKENFALILYIHWNSAWDLLEHKCLNIKFS